MALTDLSELQPLKGRGAAENPGNRFEQMLVELDPDAIEDLRVSDPDFEIRRPKTVFFRDDSQSIISRNSSPDLGFDASLNPYRGCEHGCSYCYARPYHEYLGFSAGLDFETKIMVKENAPELLERELSSPKWTPQTLACSGVTDCFQPVERKLEITRRCLEVLAKFRNPVTVVTKNHLVTRDIDHLKQLAADGACSVALSITTLDPKLAAKLEPRASSPEYRLRAIEELSAAGIPTVVSVAPIIPGLNDHEIPAILSAAAERGATRAFYVILRLPHGVSELFMAWLDRHEPGRREKIEGRIREMRGGQLNDSTFKTRMKGEGALAAEISALFRVAAHRAGLNRDRIKLNTDSFRKPGGIQLQLF
ncbi:MAG: DNA repair photolyase [Verrucomicrobiales bacterium]|jgi:DNA repair photolyase